MKKWIVGLLILCLLFLAGIWFFIPGTLTISRIVTISSPNNVTTRFLLDQTKWHQWWPEYGSNIERKQNQIFQYRGYSYIITGLFSDKISVLTLTSKDSLATDISILPGESNSITLQWKGRLSAGSYPFERLQQYRKGIRVKNNMTAILDSLQKFLENTSNVYGFPIKEIISSDSTLIAVRYQSSRYPQTTEIYGLIDSIKKFIAKQNGLQTNHPMLRVLKINDSSYQTMVALPTSKALTGSGNFFFLRFVPYKTLTGTVRGGVNTIELAFKQMEIYVEDHRRTSMAAPFQMLVTDRSLENDPQKWVTLICQPVS